MKWSLDEIQDDFAAVMVDGLEQLPHAQVGFPNSH